MSSGEITFITKYEYQRLRRHSTERECLRHQLEMIHTYVNHMCDEETKRFINIIIDAKYK